MRRRQIEVQRRDRDVPGGDGGQVGPLLVVVHGRVAVDAKATASVLLLDDLQLVAVDALAEPRDPDPVRLARRDVHVHQRALGQGHVVEALDHARDERRGGAELEALAEPEVHLARERLLGHRDPRHAEHHALQRRCDGARVGDVVA